MNKIDSKLHCEHCHVSPHKAAKPSTVGGKNPAKTKIKKQLVKIILAALLFAGGLIFSTRLQNIPGGIGKYLVFIPAYLLVGGPILKAAGRQALAGRFFNEFFLMAVATLGAILIDQLAEAVGVMLFFTTGELLQDLAVNRSRNSIAELLNLRPDCARLVVAGGNEEVDPETVEVGREILVKPGEKIPLDGVITTGSSFVDTSALTGESVPRRVEPEDIVAAGMLNGSGLLKIKVTKKFAQSSLAKIMHLIEEAADKKAPVERFITRFATWYTPLVVFSALLLAVIPPLLVPGARFADWLYRALILLVISCPCALVISIPLGYFGGIGGASRQGILIKGADVLDELTKIDTVVFDKTGTLTEGIFAVEEIIPQKGFRRKDILAWAAKAESFSNHPIAVSLRRTYGKALHQEDILNYQEIKGQGIKATIDNKEILVGNHRLLANAKIKFIRDDSPYTTVYIALNGTWAGTIIIADRIKESSFEAVKSLRNLGVKNIYMLTGDKETTAAHVADCLKLDGFRADLLPEEKVSFVRNMEKNEGGKVLFAGDGFNDAPVLMHASVGVAMGALGTDAAIEAADIVLMDDNPEKIARAMSLAQFTQKIVRQNIIFSLAIKGAFAITGALGIATMWGAVFADVGVALLAILNATRTLFSVQASAKTRQPAEKAKQVDQLRIAG